MSRRIFAPLLCALAYLSVLGTQQLHAQFPYSRPGANPYIRPPISPYLNLLRGGNPAVNYYGVVRPEQQFYNSFQQLNQQVAANQIQLGDVEAQASQPLTGHPAYFMNLSHYYPGGMGQRAPGGTGGTHTNAPPSNTARPSTGSASAPRR